VLRALISYLVSTASQFFSPHLPCLVQEGEVFVCLGGTSTAYTLAQVGIDGDGSFVIEGAVNNAFRCPTPHLPLFHRNELNSCEFVHLFLECQNLGDFLGMAKRQQALV
jgi:hypothetical protein